MYTCYTNLEEIEQYVTKISANHISQKQIGKIILYHMGNCQLSCYFLSVMDWKNKDKKYICGYCLYLRILIYDWIKQKNIFLDLAQNWKMWVVKDCLMIIIIFIYDDLPYAHQEYFSIVYKRVMTCPFST